MKTRWLAVLGVLLIGLTIGLTAGCGGDSGQTVTKPPADAPPPGEVDLSPDAQPAEGQTP